jgi:DNA-binding LacI/PurR family transcriptional regulator
MAVTIRDIAREAGVSISTVSKVINGAPTISQKTIDNVHAVMERLEYVPNQRAANFARASTRNVTCLTTLNKGMAYEQPHIFEMICGVQDELDKKGYTLTLIDTSREKIEGETARKVILQKGTDGLIIQGDSINKTTADFITKKGFPHIVVGKPNFKHGLSWIDTNNVVSGEKAAQHLYEYGYKNIAFIGGKEDDVISVYRLQGVRTFLSEHDMEIRKDCVCCIEQDVNESYEAMLSLLDLDVRPDAVICENSLIAVGVFKALEHRQIHAPDEIGVVMIDDNPYSKILTPMPTVVNIDIYDLGVQAVKSLMRKIKKPELQVQAYTTIPELIIRETTRDRSDTNGN